MLEMDARYRSKCMAMRCDSRRYDIMMTAEEAFVLGAEQSEAQGRKKKRRKKKEAAVEPP